MSVSARRTRVSKRRWIVAIVLLLVGGMVVNVGVAWGCIAIQRNRLSAHQGSIRFVEIDAETRCVAILIEKAGFSYATVSNDRSFWAGLGRPFEPTPRWLREQCPRTPFVKERYFEAAGLPLRCGLTEWEVFAPGKSEHGGYLPLWPGFAINPLFYALVLALPWAGFVQMRRISRSRAGRCRACGYDLSATPDDSPCPECGRESSGVTP